MDNNMNKMFSKTVKQNILFHMFMKCKVKEVNHYTLVQVIHLQKFPLDQ